jgi:hypothetical protein
MNSTSNLISIVGSLRLIHAAWPKLRSLLAWHGRPWFEKWIDREYKKLGK